MTYLRKVSYGSGVIYAFDPKIEKANETRKQSDHFWYLWIERTYNKHLNINYNGYYGHDTHNQWQKFAVQNIIGIKENLKPMQ